MKLRGSRKYNDKTIELIEKGLKGGMFVTQVCRAVGITKDTFYRWYNYGKKGKKKYVKFYEAVNRAENFIEKQMVSLITVRAIEDWRAAAWFLERRFPDRWAKHENVNVSSNGGQVILKIVEAGKKSGTNSGNDT